MKKLLSLSLAMLMIASCAVGCGDEDDDDSGSKKKKNSSSNSSSFSDNDEDDSDLDEDDEDDEEDDEDDKDDDDDDDDNEDDEDDDDDDDIDNKDNKKASNKKDKDKDKDKDSKSSDNKKNSGSKKISKKGTSISESDIVGKWEAEKLVTDDGIEMTNIFGIPLAITFQFEFKKNGTCVVSEQMMDLAPDEEAPEGTWEISGDSLVVTVENADSHKKESLEFKMEDDKLVAKNVEEDMEGALYLVQVDEFTKFDLNSLADSLDLGSLLGGDGSDFNLDDFDFGDIDWDE